MNLPEPIPDAPYRILVVDDNHAIHEDFRKTLCEDLSGKNFDEEDASFFGTAPPASGKARYELDFASQGQEALDLLATARDAGRRYSVVFVDVRMPPGLDGVETTARILEIDSDVQVVICTAFCDYTFAEIIKRLGGTDRITILRKPFNVTEVVERTLDLTAEWVMQREARLKAGSVLRPPTASHRAREGEER
jgi:two-component system NtrC family sensor kinase